MRPNASLDPPVEFVEERSDVGTFVVVAPAPQNWGEVLDQILGFQRDASLGKLTHPILEALDRFLAGIGIQATRLGTRDDLARRQFQPPSAPDQVAQKLESMMNVHHSRFLRM